ncbi:hypothetical protein MKP05_09410 [Halomonas sp. EGI 63088]|uniref:Uncharacterized protein n=1 Tax=Halomonas flagellata TaxID=2920385 RepID=A0ABS9RU13_9GAMM|nr:hypothetical protein [Halomonas flagellata]MCH4563346.1 hypothetical protein [Halomonas flagellata]
MIYTVENRGRPVRVFVNGNEVRKAIYADTERGIVRYYPEPIRIKRGTDEVYTRTLRGQVTVEPMH